MRGTQKPVDKRSPRADQETLWKAIRMKRVFTLAEISRRCSLAKNTIALHLRSWTRSGNLKAVPVEEKGANGQGGKYRKQLRYTLIKDASEFPRVREDGSEITQGTARQHMWNTIRARRVFSVNDVIALSSTREHPIRRAVATEYIKYLEKAGYVLNIYAGAPIATYRLIRDTGLRAPMIQRVRQVWDPNLRKVMWPLPGEDKR